MSILTFVVVCLVCGLFCAFLATFVHFAARWRDPAPALDAIIAEAVSETIIKVIDDCLPSLAEEVLTKKFEREPDLELTNAGFGWALSIALRKHWPDLDGETASRWLREYIAVPHGRKGYTWTYATACEIAAQYVSDFGEAA
ncbi:hypothetical protein J2857_003574 [Neorhizobium galegae]|uniref:hypothetical protein n=1 Tax=Neorhizobium galegae TaxID=399 RepID=UPI001AE77047|nr:hypothetical protein [Neorhizobium galegae]MBP2560805.1 hypothetical protein [Neorhizobium galegae]